MHTARSVCLMTVPRCVYVHWNVLPVGVLNFRPKRPGSHVLIADIMLQHLLIGKSVSCEESLITQKSRLGGHRACVQVLSCGLQSLLSVRYGLSFIPNKIQRFCTCPFPAEYGILVSIYETVCGNNATTTGNFFLKCYKLRKCNYLQR